MTSILVIWSVAVTAFRANQVGTLLGTRASLQFFYHFPVTNAEVLRHQTSLILRSSCWLGLDWLAFGIAVALNTSSVLSWCAVAALAITQWAAALALATLLARRFPRVPYASLALPLYFSVLLSSHFASDTSPWQPFAVGFLDLFTLFTPPGWLAWAFGAVSQSGSALGWVILLSVGASAYWILSRQLVDSRAHFSLERIFEYDPTESLQTPESGSKSPESDGVASDPLGNAPSQDETPATSINLSKLKESLSQILESPAGLALFHRGFIERMITRALTLRQRVLVDFLRPSGFGWTRGWLVGLGSILVAHFLNAIGRHGVLPTVISLGGVALFSLPLFGGLWIGFNPLTTFTTRIGYNSFVPLGFWEWSRLMLTVSALRCLAALPLVLLAVTFETTVTPLPWNESAAWTLKAFIAVLTIQPIWIIGAVSKNSNDSSSRWWFSLFMILFLPTIFVALLGGGAVFFAIDSYLTILSAGLALFATSHLVLLFYGWAYNRNIFDLVAKTVTR